jgi:undecaprenyl-diphosphatase
MPSHPSRGARRHEPGFRAEAGRYLPIAIAVIAICTLGFVVLLGVVSRGGLTGFDSGILLWMGAHDNRHLDGAALEITSLGSVWVVWLSVFVASVLFWNAGHRSASLTLWLALLGNLALNFALKSVIGRARPDLFEWRTPYAGEFAFPSGHSMTAMAVYATMAYLVARHTPSHRVRLLSTLAFGLAILMVGISRVYLGVHFPTDVLAGFLVGLAWAAFCALVGEWFRYREEAGAGEWGGWRAGG